MHIIVVENGVTWHSQGKTIEKFQNLLLEFHGTNLHTKLKNAKIFKNSFIYLTKKTQSVFFLHFRIIFPRPN